MTNMVNMTNKKDGKLTLKSHRTIRFVVMLTNEEMEAIEDHRFANRIGATSEAVRTLIRLGLNSQNAETRSGGSAVSRTPALAGE